MTVSGSTRLKGKDMSDVEKTPNKGPRWVKIALGVSLSVNVLVVGLAIAMVTMVQRGGTPVRTGEAAGAYTFALSPKDRRDIGHAVTQEFRKSGKDRSGLRAEYQNMIAILVADPFDRAAAQEVLARQFEFADQRRMASEALLLDHLERMSLEDRKAYAKRLGEGMKRRSAPPVRPGN